MAKPVIIFIILASLEVVLSYQNEATISSKGMDIDSKEGITTTESEEDRLIHDHYLLKQSKPTTDKSTTKKPVKEQIPSASEVQSITVAVPNATKPEGTDQTPGKNYTKPDENVPKTSKTPEKNTTKSTSEAQVTTSSGTKTEVDQKTGKNDTKLHGNIPQTSQSPGKDPTKSSSEVQTKNQSSINLEFDQIPSENGIKQKENTTPNSLVLEKNISKAPSEVNAKTQSGSELKVDLNPGINSTKVNLPTSENNLKKLPFEGQAERIEKLLKSLNEPKWPANPMENLPQTMSSNKNLTKSSSELPSATAKTLPGTKLETNLISGSQNLGGGTFQVNPEPKSHTSEKNGTKEKLNITSTPSLEIKSTTKIPGMKLEAGDLNNGKNDTVSRVQEKLSHSSTIGELSSEAKSTEKYPNGSILEVNQTSGKNSSSKAKMPATIPVNMVPPSEAKFTTKVPGIKLEGGDLNNGKNSTIPKGPEKMPTSSTTPGLASEVKSTTKYTNGTKLEANQTSGINGTLKENTVQGIPPTKSFVTAASEVRPTTIKASNGTKLEGGDLNSGKNGTLPPKVQENGVPAASRIKGVPLYILSKLKSSQNSSKPNEVQIGTKPNANHVSDGQIVPVFNHSANASRVAGNSTLGHSKKIHHSAKNFTKANAEINQKPLAREPKVFSAETSLKGSASNDYFLRTQALPYQSEGTFFRPPIVAVENNGVSIVDKKASSEVQVQKMEPNPKTIGKLSEVPKAGGLNISGIYIQKYWSQNNMKNSSNFKGHGINNKEHSLSTGHNIPLQNHSNTHSAEFKEHSTGSSQNLPSSKEHQINSAHIPSLQNAPGNRPPNKEHSMGPGHNLASQNRSYTNSAENKGNSISSAQNPTTGKVIKNTTGNGAPNKNNSMGPGHSLDLQNHFKSNGAVNKENSKRPGQNSQSQNQTKEPFQNSAKNLPPGQFNSAHSPSLQNHYANVASFKENPMGPGHNLPSQNHSKTNGAGIKETGMGSAKNPLPGKEPLLNTAHSPSMQNHPPGSGIGNKNHLLDPAHGPSLQNRNANGATSKENPTVLGHNLSTQDQSKTNGAGIKQPGLSNAKNPLPGKEPQFNSAHSPYLQNSPVNAVPNNQQSTGPGHGLPSQSHFKTNGAGIKEPVLGSGQNQPSGKENHLSAAQSPSSQNHPPGIGTPNKDHPLDSVHSLPSHNASKPNVQVLNKPSLGSSQNTQNNSLMTKGGMPLNLAPPLYPSKNFTSITPKPLPKTLMIGGNNSNPQLVPVVQTGPIKKYGTGVVPNPNGFGSSGLAGMASTFIPRVTTPNPGSFHNFGGVTVRSTDQTQGPNLLTSNPFLTTAKVVVNPLDIAITAKPISSAEKGTMTHRPIGVGLHLNRHPQETNTNPAQNATKTVANPLASHPSGTNVTLNVPVQKAIVNGVSNSTHNAPGKSGPAAAPLPIGAIVSPNAKVSNTSGKPLIPNSAGINHNVQAQKNGSLGATNTTRSTLGSHTTIKPFTPLSILTALRSSAQIQKPAPTNSTLALMGPSHGQVSTARPVMTTYVPFGNGMLNGEKKATNSHPKPHLESTTPKSPNLTHRPTVGSGPTTPKVVLGTPSSFYAGPSTQKPGIGVSTMKPVQAGHGAPLNAGPALNGALPGAPKPLHAGPTTHKPVPIENKIGVSTMKPVPSRQSDLLNAQFYGGTTHLPGLVDYKIGASTMKSVPGLPGGPPNAQITTSKTIGANSIVVTTLRPSTIIIVPSSTVNSIVPNSIPSVLPIGGNAEKASAAKILNMVQHNPPVPGVTTMHPPGPGGSPKTVSSTINYAPKMAEHPKIPGNPHLSTLVPPYLNAGPGGLPKTISTTHIPKVSPAITPTPKPTQSAIAPSLEHGLGGLPKTVYTTMHPSINQATYNPDNRQHDPFGLRKAATTSPPYVGPGGLPKAKPHTSPKPKLDTVIGVGLLEIPGEQRPNVNKVAPIESGPPKIPPSTTTRPIPQMSPVVPKHPQGTIRPNQITEPTTKPGESTTSKSATGLPGLPKMGSTTSGSKVTESTTKSAPKEIGVFQSIPKDSTGNRPSSNEVPSVPREPNMDIPQKTLSSGKMDSDSQIKEELEIPQDVELIQESPDLKEGFSNGAKEPSLNQQRPNEGNKFSEPNSAGGASDSGFKLGNQKYSDKKTNNTSISVDSSDGDTENDLVVEQDIEVDKSKKDIIIEHNIFVKNGPRPTNSQKIDRNEVTINRRGF